MSINVSSYAGHDELYRSAALAVVEHMGTAIHAAGRCSIALSGGSTPIPLHRLLATEFAQEVQWNRVHVFWGDERYVPPASPHSNYGMARRTLLDHVPCPAENIHPMPTSAPDPGSSALEYERTLREHFGEGVPAFDVMLLGIGSDGHIASLFPGSPALLEEDRNVLAVTAAAEVARRLTLTLPVIRRAAHIHMLVKGAEKAAAVGKALSADAELFDCPAAALQRTGGEVRWWLDSAAAGG